MAWRIGDDKFAVGCGKVAIGHIDGDALLPLGAQTIGEERQVQVGVAPLAAGPLDGSHLIFHDRLAVQQQTTDQGAFAIVDAAGGGEAQHVYLCGHRACSVLRVACCVFAC